MSYPALDLTGKKFDMLTVVEMVARTRKKESIRWLCLCDCGRTKAIDGYSLKIGRVVNCGCVNGRELMFKNHGMCYTKEYRAWHTMKLRCLNPNNKNYDLYGGRGIVVCDRWVKSFMYFYEDMGDCPLGHSLDRINNEGGYNKENCRWASLKTQARNKRNNALITLPNGEKIVLVVASEIYNCSYTVVSKRYNRFGDDFSRVFAPIKSIKKKNSI